MEPITLRRKEAEIITLLKNGCSYRIIAAILDTTEEQISTRLDIMMKKYNCHNIKELVDIYYKEDSEQNT